MESRMFRFKVSSPGKVILHGEHSVVYGKPALAGVIGARNFLLCNEHESSVVEFKFTSIGTEFKFEVSDINALLSVIRSVGNESVPLETIALNEVTTFINSRNESTNPQELKAFVSTVFLLCGILLENDITSMSNGFDVNISSEMSVGAGLGSSASFGVCLAACFLVLARFQTADKNPFQLSTEDKTFISKWAFQSEKIMHGMPSGIDNTVCTFGNIVKFSKGKPIEHISTKSKINVLLVDSDVSRSTVNLVNKVADLKNQFPSLVDHILNGMGEIVEQTIPLYESVSTENNNKFISLAKLFQVNNDLLKAIGVSHPKLEEIFSIALANEFSSKITGAGGGGYALILLPDEYKGTAAFRKLCADLTAAQFTYIETTVGGAGVIVENLSGNVQQ